MMDKHLMRMIYRTDATIEEPDYLGMFSSTIPARMLSTAEIVNVDWSRRGWVEVTYLIPGGHLHGGNVLYNEEPARSDEDIAKSVAALMINTMREGGYASAVNDVEGEPDLESVVVDGEYDLIALARAIVTEVKGA